MSELIVQGAKRYIELVYQKFDGNESRVLMAVVGCYGNSHDQDEDESNASYIERCLEQDFVDGFKGAAMFPDLYGQACAVTMDALDVDAPSIKEAVCNTDTYWGKEAISRFTNAASRFSDEDSTGHAFGFYRRADGLVQMNLSADLLIKVLDGGRAERLCLDDFDYLLIDSGNSSGDAWKCFYFAGSQTCVFIREN